MEREHDDKRARVYSATTRGAIPPLFPSSPHFSLLLSGASVWRISQSLPPHMEQLAPISPRLMKKGLRRLKGFGYRICVKEFRYRVYG